MGKTASQEMVSVPKEEYAVLRELYKTVKRQNFLLRLAEAEKNLKSGKVKKIPVDKFISGI